MKHLECALGEGNQFWKYIIVLFVSFFGASIIGSIPLVVVIFAKMMGSGGSPDANIDMYNLEAYGISSNLGLFLMLLPLVLGLFVIVFFVKVMHKRSYQEIINGTYKIRWKRIGAGAAFWTVLSAILLVIQYLINPSNFTFQLDLSSFIPLIFISLIFIPMQTSFEEIAFRGYFAQGVGALTKNRWWVLIIPSVVFGLLHIANPEVKEYGILIMLPQYILMGAIFGIISILDDGIELALGVHAANNVFLSLFVTHSSSALQTAAVFNVKEVDPVGGLIEITVTGILLIAFFYKKYGWSFSTLNKKIQKPDNTY